MKKRNKKSLLLWSMLVASTLPFISISCSSLIRPELERNELSVYYDSTGTEIKKFSKDYSAGLYKISNHDMHLLAPSSLVVLALENETQYEVKETKAKDSIYKEPEYKVKQATHSFYRFGFSEKIIVTTNDDKVVVFDNDKHEIIPENNDNSPFLTLSSSDPKSINSVYFLNILKKAKKMQFVIKKNVPWVHYNGEKSNFNIVPMDFLYGWKRTLLSSTKYRRQHGGSKELDEKIIVDEKLDGNGTFGDNSVLSNMYLLDVFGINKTNLENENTFLTKYDNSEDKAVTFYGEDKPIFDNFFKQVVVDSTFFAPIPSQFIDIKNKEKESELDEKALKPKGEAHKYGIYWYGKDYKDDLLYASRYLPFYLSINRDEYIRNKYFPETTWQDKDREEQSIQKIIHKYNKYPDGVQYSNSILNNYVEGSKSIFNQSEYNNLSSSNKNILNKNKKEIRYNSSDDKDELKRMFNFSLIPGPMNYLPENNNYEGGKAPKKWYFNDVFAKLVYGTDLDKIANGEMNVAENGLNKYSLAFRTILDSSFNTYSFVKNNNTSLEPWISFAPPDNIIGGKDQELASKKTFRDYYDELNTQFAINHKNEVIYQKTLKDEKEHYSKFLHDIKTQYKTPKFEVLQKAMKELLDDFYKTNNIDLNSKVEFTINNRYFNEQPSRIQALDAIAKVYQELDPRIQVNTITSFGAKKKDYLNILLSQYGIIEFSGWHSDYDGAGTFLDGMVNKGALLAIASQFASFSEDHNLVKVFPEFYKYSKKLKKYFDDEFKKDENNAYKFIEFSKWKNARNLSDFQIDKVKYLVEGEEEEGEVIDNSMVLIPLLNEKNENINNFSKNDLNQKIYLSKYYEIEEENGKPKLIYHDNVFVGDNDIKEFFTMPTFEWNGKTYLDETLVRKFTIDDKEVIKVYSHARKKWVNPARTIEFSALVSIFNLNFQNETTNDEIIKLFKEIVALTGLVPFGLAVASDTPSVFYAKENLIIPKSPYNLSPIGSYRIRKDKK
ncbi:OppA family ABC transporter substrate-binding lipoprotein [Mesomycoplasma neurolyticum]|uniref:Lipoprotein n=1 Tax=Mesomycoplasma neurolyticum TaxID=2120 RepID=A0A449A6H5_9BACT|nr:hypothetical protein [Mesomycoplasma neurolyticum]VEU59844.1 Uncharacterised protein [Mesomycoplasma neurolyticum]